MKKISLCEKIFIILVIALCGLTTFCALIGAQLVRQSVTPVETRTLEPTVCLENLEDEILTFKFIGEEWVQGRSTIMFYTSHQTVKVEADGKVIYERKPVNSIFGHSPGSAWNHVTVPAKTKELIVTIDAVYEDAIINTNIEFTVGAGSWMILERIRNGFVHSLVCLLIIMIGICLITYYLITRAVRSDLRELLYLGIFALLLGWWGFGETELAQIIITNRVLASFTAFLAIGAMGPSSILFARYFFKTNDKIFFYTVMTYCILIMVVPTVLQIANIVDFREIAIVIQSTILAGLSYWLYALTVHFRRGTERYKGVVNMIGLGILTVAIGIDFMAYYTDRTSANRTGKFGFLIYIILLGAETLHHSVKNLEEHHQLEFYREMAITDALTGCLNRNAYEHALAELGNPDEYAVATFDLNNLKHCNDTYGHATGDEYIMRASRIMRDVIGKYGKLYRTGGDEFVALLPRVSLRRLQTIQQKVAADELFDIGDVPIGELGCACGYAKYDSSKDKTLEDTVKRADANMYETKKMMKDHKVIE